MPHPTTPAVVRHPETGLPTALNPAIDYDPADPLVIGYPWAFEPRDTTVKVVESVRIESASAAPGEQRSRTRAKK